MAATIVLVVCLAAGGSLLTDPDTYWHSTVGEQILKTGSLPHSDVFTWSVRGEPWIAKEWLSQLLLAGARGFGGWPGVVLLTAVAIALAFGGLCWYLTERLPVLPTAGLLSTSFVIAAPHLLARPHTLVLPLLVLWTGALVRAVDRGYAPPWWLLGMMVLWVNMHGSFLVGVVLAVGLGVEAVVAATPETRGATSRTWVGFAGAAAAACLVTPYGWRIAGAGLAVLRVGDGLTVIREWQPADFGDPGPFEVMLVLVVALLLVSRLRLRWPRALVLAGLVGLALRAVRNGDVLGMAGPLLVAGPMAAQLRLSGPMRSSRATAGLIAIAGLGIAVTASVLTFGRETLVPTERWRPAAALEVVDALGARRVLNDHSFGGYMIDVRVPTYVDGRTELFGREFVVRHDAAIRADPPEVLRALLDEEGIEVTLLQPGTPALAHLDASPDWERVFADDVAVVHIRVPPADG